MILPEEFEKEMSDKYFASNILLSIGTGFLFLSRRYTR